MKNKLVCILKNYHNISNELKDMKFSSLNYNRTFHILTDNNIAYDFEVKLDDIIIYVNCYKYLLKISDDNFSFKSTS